MLWVLVKPVDFARDVAQILVTSEDDESRVRCQEVEDRRCLLHYNSLQLSRMNGVLLQTDS